MRAYLMVLALLLSLVACGGADGPSTGDDNPVAAWSAAVETRAERAAAAHQSLLDAIRAASGDFAVNLASGPAPEDAVAPFDAALAAAIAAQAVAYSAGVEAALWAARATDEAGADELARDGLAIQRRPLVFAVLIAAGVAVTGWGAKKGIDKAIDARAEPVLDKIDAATPAELQLVRDELGLDESATKAEVLAHYLGLGMSARHSATRKLEEALFEAANQAVAPADVSEVDAGAIRQAVANSAVACGEVAVATTVSLATTATGGQGYSQALEAVGMGATAAAVTDLTISAVSTATDTPLQPLDLLASRLDVTVVSQETRPVTVPAPASRVAAEEAVETLSSPSASAADQNDAAASLALDVIEAHAAGLLPRTEADGGVTVEVPVQVHTTQVAAPTAEQTLVIPQMPGGGQAGVMITATDMVPALFEDVDTTQPVSLQYPAISVEAVEIPDGGEPWCQGEGDWACDENDCIREDQICDGTVDCANGLDEGDFCWGGGGCTADEFDCTDGGHLEPGVECIPWANRCDGNVDCFLSDEDERGCE